MALITEMWAWIAEKGPDEEGLPAFEGPNGPIPLVSADRERMENVRDIAEDFARQHGMRVKLVRFHQMEVLEHIDPGARPGSN